MQEFIARGNIKHYQELLKLPHPDCEGVVLTKLLLDEKRKLAGLVAEH